MESFGSIKRAVAVAAIVAGSAFVPAAAQADVWSTGGAPYAGPAQLVGTLSTSVGSWTSTCTVAAKADIDNGAAGGVARGDVQAYLTGSAAGGSCSTNLPNCSVSITPVLSPTWPISTSGRNVTVSGITYGVTYSGGGCALNGATSAAWGSMTGSMAGGSNSLTFVNSPGLTMTFGPATVSGTLQAFAENAAGNPDPTRPITLQP